MSECARTSALQLTPFASVASLFGVIYEFIICRTSQTRERVRGERKEGRQLVVPTPLACSMSVSSPAKLRNGMTAEQTYKRGETATCPTRNWHATRRHTPKGRQCKVKRDPLSIWVCVWLKNNSTQFMWLHLDYKIDKLTMSGAKPSQSESSPGKPKAASNGAS